jgi:hypothetical protein
MMEHFSRMSQIVTTLVVKARALPDRVEILKKLIDVASICLKLNNFNAMNEIISGLHVTSVYRLRRTWAAIPKEKREAYAECIKLIDTEENHARFQEMLHRVPKDVPCLPYFGYFLNQINSLEDQPDIILEGVINFQKRALVFLIGRKFAEYLQKPYPYEPDPHIQRILGVWRGLSDDDCFAQSIESEPRETIHARQTKRPETPVSVSFDDFSLVSHFTMLKYWLFFDQANENSSILGKWSKKDSDREIVMGPGKGTRQGMQVVMAGTIDKLIGRLIGELESDPSILDSEYLSVFLLLYRTFTTPLELIERIHKRSVLIISIYILLSPHLLIVSFDASSPFSYQIPDQNW